jgi:MazG family protein
VTPAATRKPVLAYQLYFCKPIIRDSGQRCNRGKAALEGNKSPRERLPVMDKSDPCRTLKELLSTMHRLRAPGGCPWDAEQTPESLLPYLLEEACEVIDAIEMGHPPAIVDELGDLLLQIVFQAEIFSERGLFDFADVATAINRKLLHRHPHVFAKAGCSTPATAEELSLQWERLKQQEQSAHPVGDRHPLGALPGRLPALQRAQKLLTRAHRQGVVINQAPFVEPLNPQTGEELGEQLFQLVRRAEELGLDAESALRQTIRRVLRETHAAALSTGDENDLFQ